MFLGGLWHGAAWSYAACGMAHGLALAVERFFGLDQKHSRSVFFKIFQGTVVFMYVTFAWLLFKLPDFQHVLLYLKAMIHNLAIPMGKRKVLLSAIYMFPVFALHMSYLFRASISASAQKSVLTAAYAIMLFLILTNSGGAGAFIYFQF
jgi:alginate O-acetyltransferase complex protein AlgI